MKISSYLTHKHTSNECAISIVSVCRRPVASITYKNPVEIVGGNCKPSPIISSNLLVWARVSRWLRLRASVNFRGPKHIPLLQAYPPFRGVLCPLVVIVMLFVKYDNSLLTDSLNCQIAPPFTVISLACEKSDTLSFMNDDHSTRTTDFVPWIVMCLVNRVIG